MELGAYMRIRLRGALMLTGAGLFYALLFVAVLRHGLDGSSDAGLGPLKVVLLGVPGAIALIGLIELLGGIAFNDLSRRWDELRGWQRGVLGSLVTLVAFALLYLGIVFYGWISF